MQAKHEKLANAHRSDHVEFQEILLHIPQNARKNAGLFNIQFLKLNS